MPEAPDPETVPVWQERLKEYGDQVPARWLRPRPVDGQQPGSVTTGEPARKPWRIMTADSAIDGH